MFLFCATISLAENDFISIKVANESEKIREADLLLFKEHLYRELQKKMPDLDQWTVYNKLEVSVALHTHSNSVNPDATLDKRTEMLSYTYIDDMGMSRSAYMSMEYFVYHVYFESDLSVKARLTTYGSSELGTLFSCQNRIREESQYRSAPIVFPKTAVQIQWPFGYSQLSSSTSIVPDAIIRRALMNSATELAVKILERYAILSPK